MLRSVWAGDPESASDVPVRTAITGVCETESTRALGFRSDGRMTEGLLQRRPLELCWRGQRTADWLGHTLQFEQRWRFGSDLSDERNRRNCNDSCRQHSAAESSSIEFCFCRPWQVVLSIRQSECEVPRLAEIQ